MLESGQKINRINIDVYELHKTVLIRITASFE